MNSIIKDLTLGFAQESEIYTIYAKQCDTMRKIKFEFIDDDDEYEPVDISAVYFKEKYSDGKIVLPQLIEIGDDLTMQLEREMLLVPGLAHCELAFIKYLPDPSTGVITPAYVDDTGKIIGNYDILTTQTFNIYIEESAGVGDVIAGKSVDDLIAIVLLGKQYAEDSEAWARGTRNGTEVDPTDRTYNNNAWYWADKAQTAYDQISGQIKLHQATSSSSIKDGIIEPTISGDAYPITDLATWTTNNRFERSGEQVPVGSLVYATTNHKWDYMPLPLLGFNKITYDSEQPQDGYSGDIWIG